MILSWNTTNQCNMYCAHCYREAGEKAKEELTTAEGMKLIDEIKKAGFRIMIFSGGEPLMRPDIFDLIQHASSIGLRPVLGTNGSLITKEVAQKLKDSGMMGVGISLDSLDIEKHNKLRGYEGAWEEAVRGMENCRAVGLGFQIHTTVMDWNAHEVCDIMDFAVEKGAVAHHIFFLVPTGRGKAIEAQALDRHGYEETLKTIMSHAKTVPIEVKPTCAPQFLRVAKQMDMDLRFTKGCIAGLSYCIIGPRGKVQPCAYMDNEIANVREMPFDEIWRTNQVFNDLRTEAYSGACGVCGFNKKCGGCRARAAYYNDGDYMAEDPICEFGQDVLKAGGKVGG